jgi:hypothetical protein
MAHKHRQKIHLAVIGVREAKCTMNAITAVSQEAFERLPPEQMCKRCLSHLTAKKAKQKPAPLEKFFR